MHPLIPPNQLKGDSLIVRHLGLQAFQPVWQKMYDFTDTRTQDSLDECWVLEHLPVFTQGLSGKPEHLLRTSDIPVIKTDRGGQITYHGPGQLMIYMLIDLNRKQLSIRPFVTLIETAVVEFLAGLKIQAQTQREAPGVYVEGAKICSLGLKVRRGASYHGLSFNVNMDLAPFNQINPCGYPGLKMTQLADLGIECSPMEVAPALLSCLSKQLSYTNIMSGE